MDQGFAVGNVVIVFHLAKDGIFGLDVGHLQERVGTQMTNFCCEGFVLHLNFARHTAG